MCLQLLLDDASETATPLTNGAINQTLRQFASLNDDRLLQLVDCRESSTSIGHLLKKHPEQHKRPDLGLSPGCLGPFGATCHAGSINVDHATGQ